MVRRWIALLGWSLLVNSSAHAGYDVIVGRIVSPGKRVGMESIDHSKWNDLLRRHVDGRGYVNYSDWKASASDQKLLDEYLDHLASASLSTKASANVRLAFWINAYNALTVKGILREYPTSSIRNHTAVLWGYNIWKNLLLRVDGRTYSLEAIENDILRKMGEPRIHFGIVCASVGCPRLRNEAYVADRLDEQLNDNARDFFASRSRFVGDPQSGVISVSPILKWFARDFGPDLSSQMKSIAPHVPSPSRRLAESGKARVQYLDYDWSLNDQAKLASTDRK